MAAYELADVSLCCYLGDGDGRGDLQDPLQGRFMLFPKDNGA